MAWWIWVLVGLVLLVAEVTRTDDRSGRPFTLRKGETLAQRVGVLVHRGDAVSGRVRER